jgi:hypothetical protein
MIRTAISPRLAIRIFMKRTDVGQGAASHLAGSGI